MIRVTFDVAGLPVPQGSLRSFVRGGHAVTTHANGRNLDAWRIAVATEARAAATALLEGAVAVEVIFLLPRPAGHTGARGLRASAPPYPSGRPDLDKLARSVLDALTGTVIGDDGQVTDLVVRKRYADPGRQPGAAVSVWERVP